MSALGGGAAGDAAATALHQANNVGPRELEGRRKAKDDSRREGQTDAEEEYRQIDLDDRLGRKEVRQPSDDRRQATPSDQDAQSRADQGYEKSFGQQLTNDAPAIRANSSAHGDLMLAFGAAGEQENGNVGAADQE